MSSISVLGLPDGTSDGIKKSWRKLTIQFHPDKNGSDTPSENRSKLSKQDAEHQMLLLNSAYEVLKDPVKRRAYDRLPSPAQGQQADRAEARASAEARARNAARDKAYAAQAARNKARADAAAARTARRAAEKAQSEKTKPGEARGVPGKALGIAVSAFAVMYLCGAVYSTCEMFAVAPCATLWQTACGARLDCKWVVLAPCETLTKRKNVCQNRPDCTWSPGFFSSSCEASRTARGSTNAFVEQLTRRSSCKPQNTKPGVLDRHEFAMAAFSVIFVSACAFTEEAAPGDLIGPFVTILCAFCAAFAYWRWTR